MKPVTVSVVVERPAEEVFDHLAVLANHEAFTDHMLADWTVSGPAEGRHARARARSTAPGPEDWIDIEVIDAEAPFRYVERSTGAHGHRMTLGVYELEPLWEDRTRVTFTLAFEKVPAYERLIAPVVRHWVQENNQRALRRLREVLTYDRSRVLVG